MPLYGRLCTTIGFPFYCMNHTRGETLDPVVVGVCLFSKVVALPASRGGGPRCPRLQQLSVNKQRSRGILPDWANDGESGSRGGSEGWARGQVERSRGWTVQNLAGHAPPGPQERSSCRSGAQPRHLDYNQGSPQTPWLWLCSGINAGSQSSSLKTYNQGLAGMANSPGDTWVLGPALERPKLGFEHQTSRLP